MVLIFGNFEQEAAEETGFAIIVSIISACSCSESCVNETGTHWLHQVYADSTVRQPTHLGEGQSFLAVPKLSPVRDPGADEQPGIGYTGQTLSAAGFGGYWTLGQ